MIVPGVRSTNLFGSERGMTLLCGDHLTRGKGEKRMSMAILFTLIELVINAILVWECLADGGRVVLAAIAPYIGVNMESAPMKLDEVKAVALLAASFAYTTRVIIWTLFVQHSDVAGPRSLFLIFWYHIFLHCSQPVVAFLPQADIFLDGVTLCSGLGLAFAGFSLELMADLQMKAFKANAKNKEATGAAAGKNKEATGAAAGKKVLDTGLWSICRHPNYLFNAFGVAGIALLTGWWPYALVWFGIQVFWVYAQSGPSHEMYMARTYGPEWEDYTKRVGFLFPKLHKLG